MSLENSLRAAAKSAEKAVNRAMLKYEQGLVTDEDDLTGVLVGSLDAALEGDIEGLHWSSSILRHRKGVAAEEKRIGADMLIHVSLNTPLQTYSKGVLIQAKRREPGELMTEAQHDDLHEQCKTMLRHTPSAFVFDYARGAMRTASASKISGSANLDLWSACNWTSYRFFWELFRSPIGDPRIDSAQVSELPVPTVLALSALGDLVDE